MTLQKLVEVLRLMRFYKSASQIHLNRLLTFKIAEYIHDRDLRDVSVLNIGCGFGELEHRLSDNPWITSFDAVGSELSIVQKANRRVRSQALRELCTSFSTYRGIWALLPTPGVYYNVLVCQGEHALVQSEKEFLDLIRSNLFRQLKAGGLLLYVLPKAAGKRYWSPNTKTLRVLLPSFIIDEVGTDRIIRKTVPLVHLEQNSPEIIHLVERAA